MTFNKWLINKLEETGWSYSELARRGGTSHARISQVINNNEPPGADFCVKIAKAFGESPEHVLRLAGILEPLPENKKSGPDLAAMVKDVWTAITTRPRPAGLRESSAPYSAIEQENTSPGLEDILEVLEHLDTAEVLAVYDYALWRLEQQRRRRDSANVRRRPLWSDEEIQRLENLLAHLSSDERKALLQRALDERTVNDALQNSE